MLEKTETKEWVVKVKIAILCNGYGMINRGAERFTEEFYNHCHDIFDIDIYGIKETSYSHGTNTKSRDKFRIPWRNGKAYLESYYFGKKWYNMLYKSATYGIVFNNSGFPCSYWCNKFRKLTSTPFVTRARGGGKEERLSRMFKPDCMIFLSEHHRSQIDNGNVKTTVIPNAIDVTEYLKEQKEPELLDGLEPPYYLSTSALVGFKRNDLIIKAVAKLDEGTLIQTSDGNLKNETISLGNELLGKRFCYTGRITRETLMQLYKHCDVFVNASRQEAFGVVYLEAMAAGLPIVTQYDKRRKEIIGDAGVLIADCENISDFSSSLFYASKEDWKNKPINQAKKYDWKKIKQQYKDIFNDLQKV